MTIDTFTFNGEADMLEIRLNILDRYTDFFVLIESKETFSGKSKPLYFEENQERFKKWKDRIIHYIVEPKEFSNAFERAGYQKDCVRHVLETLTTEDNDIIYFGDIDEIWTPQNITDDKIYNLEQLNYSYCFNNRSSEQWIGTVVGKWKTFKTNTVNYWRANHTNILPNGGWHFTNMYDHNELIRKLESYDHQECNIPWVKDGLKARMDANVDYLGRTADWQGKPFEFHVDDNGLPEYILNNKEKWINKGLWKS